MALPKELHIQILLLLRRDHRGLEYNVDDRDVHPAFIHLGTLFLLGRLLQKRTSIMQATQAIISYI